MCLQAAESLRNTERLSGTRNITDKLSGLIFISIRINYLWTKGSEDGFLIR